MKKYKQKNVRFSDYENNVIQFIKDYLSLDEKYGQFEISEASIIRKALSNYFVYILTIEKNRLMGLKEFEPGDEEQLIKIKEVLKCKKYYLYFNTNYWLNLYESLDNNKIE